MLTRLVEGLQPPPCDESYYTWSFPGSPVKIRLSLDLVAGLSEHMIGAGAEDHAEAGGLLLGTTNLNAVEISGFEPFVLDRESGPRYVITEKDRPRLRESIDRWNLPESSLRVVGYFRSQRREGLCLHDEDLAVIKEFFDDPANVFLVVKPEGEDGMPTGGFFFWSDGSVFADCTFMSFPFEQQSLRIAARERPSANPDPEEGSEIDGRLEPEVPRKRFRILGIAAVLALTILALAVTLRLRDPAPKPAPASNPLALSLNPGDDAITVAWDPNSEAVRNARVGVLTITDDNRKEEVPLNGLMLQSGRLVYKPSGKAVQIALEVFSPQGLSTREMMTVVMNRGGGASAPPPGQTNQAPVKESATAAVSVVPVETASEPGIPARLPAPKPFRMSESKRQPDITPSILNLEPPALELSSTPPRQTAPQVQTPAWIMPEAPAPKETPAAAVQAAPQAAAANVTPPTAQPQPTPPKPIQQVWPELTSTVKNMVSREVVVQVRVMVDSTGKVTAAEPIPGNGAVSGFLGKSASTAARLWRFEPARTNGKAVPSEVVLVFRFAPGR